MVSTTFRKQGDVNGNDTTPINDSPSGLQHLVREEKVEKGKELRNGVRNSKSRYTQHTSWSKLCFLDSMISLGRHNVCTTSACTLIQINIGCRS